MSTQVKAVVGLDCRKILLLPGLNKDLVTTGNCMFDTNLLSSFVENRRAGLNSATYISLTNVEVNATEFIPVIGHVYSTKQGGDGNFIFKSGWNAIETWGVWSEGSVAYLQIPCGRNSVPGGVTKLSLMAQGFVAGSRQSTRLAIIGNGKNLYNGQLSTPTEIQISLDSDSCMSGSALFKLEIKNPASIYSLTGSGDKRLLGFGLLSFKYL